MSKIIEYRIGDDITSIIEDTIYNLPGNEQRMGPMEPENTFTIVTGRLGEYLLSSNISKKAADSGLIDVSLPYKEPTAFFPFASYTIPFLATVKVEVDLKLEKPEACVDNYKIAGHYKSSYGITVKDSNDNVVVELVCIGKAIQDNG